MKIRLTFGQWYDSVEVERDGEWHVLDPARSQQVWNHSPDGFAWSYNGSGPAQLALGLLLDYGLDDESAVALHQSFKAEHVATWTGAHWLPDGPGTTQVVEVDIGAWMREHLDAVMRERVRRIEARVADGDWTGD